MVYKVRVFRLKTQFLAKIYVCHILYTKD